MGGAEFVHAGGLTGRFTWIFGFKIQKKIRKHLLDHLYNFAVCFFVANQMWDYMDMDLLASRIVSVTLRTHISFSFVQLYSKF